MSSRSWRARGAASPTTSSRSSTPTRSTNGATSTSTQSLYGMGVLNGDLDAEGTATLLAALDLACPPDATGGPVPARSLAQRRADALVDICRRVPLRQGPGRPRTRRISMSPSTTPPSPAQPPGGSRASCAVTSNASGPIPLETALRLACDCAVGRVVMRGESEVLDLGRRERLVTRALRRALVARDRGCAWPGCDRPAAWCDAHHIVWWEHGGPTNQENCCLLCRRHHVLCHEGGWGINAADDGTYEIHEPPAATSATRRHGRAPPAAA